MPNIEIWIQIENHPWDACPNGIDRMTGTSFTAVPMKWNGRNMFKPLSSTAAKPLGEDALILRRYKSPKLADKSDAWSIPDDRKINPWDLNEPDPSENGTKGTIPGPVIECSVGDTVLVHFRNKDHRNASEAQTIHLDIPMPFGPDLIFDFTIPAIPMAIEKRCHSLHPHGFVFAQSSDGAYPLSPADPAQPVTGTPGPDESTLWSLIPEAGGTTFSGQFKKGDRVPPGGTFTYRWDTIGWPTTAGVWLYHDHSIYDMENVNLGAIGIIVIHNVAEPGDVDIRLAADPNTPDPAFLPGGSAVASPVQQICFPIKLPEGLSFEKIGVLPHQLEGIKAVPLMSNSGMMSSKMKSEKVKHAKDGPEKMSDDVIHGIELGDIEFKLDKKLDLLRSFCTSHFRTPPAKELILQLFHTLTGVNGMCINGRTFLGNTPTIITGPTTKMRFGVVGMGDDFHTFHIHGHRWVIPGTSSFNKATGDTDTSKLQFGGPENSPVSQFEDTKIFGPANSFSFTIDEGNGFMRASPPLGEWHMHCHVLSHMGSGMMGSLLIVNGGELAPPLSPLPVGIPSDMSGGGMTMNGGTTPMTATVRSAGSGTSLKWADDVSGTGDTTIKVGGTVNWIGTVSPPHTVHSLNSPSFADVTSLPGNHTFSSVGDYSYQCGVHGGDPVAKTGMWGIVHVVA